MKFAKIVFWVAGALGLLASVGLYVQPGSYFHLGGQVPAAKFASNAIPHGLLGVLFLIAFVMTRRRELKQEMVA